VGDEWESAEQLDEEIDEQEPFEPAPVEVKNALAHIRRPRPIQHAPGLDVNRLMSLGESEMTILEQAIEREVSPSDEFLQTELDVGRPRLSQLFNGMEKFGILTARRQGRSRLFRISAQAKDHLTNLGQGGE
jgi:DNA-binding transcriptional ArsR family regulator